MISIKNQKQLIYLYWCYNQLNNGYFKGLAVLIKIYN